MSFVFDGIEHGFVTDIPNILPGGNASIGLPVSFDTKRNAIASSTACCLFNATCKNSVRMNLNGFGMCDAFRAFQTLHVKCNVNSVQCTLYTRTRI